jgi:hypothetical protein
MRREPIIQRIRPGPSGRVLDRRRIWGFYLLLTPVLLPLSVGGAGALVCGSLDTAAGQVIGFGLIGLGAVLFIVYCVYESCLIGIYPARCYLRWLRERIDTRPDAIVAADDPDAFFVQIIPRENWRISMGENASDVGLLRVDYKRKELRYEGDLERWTVPAESVMSIRLELFTPPAGLPLLNEHTVAMLAVDLGDRDVWETPLAAHPVHFELWTPGKRRRGAELLEDVIGHLIDPKRYPPVEDERLWPLIPPPKTPEAADYGEAPGR